MLHMTSRPFLTCGALPLAPAGLLPSSVTTTITVDATATFNIVIPMLTCKKKQKRHQDTRLLRRFLEKAIRGPEPGAQVFEPLPLTPDLRAPTGRPSTFSFVFLCLSVCVALKFRSLHFTHPVYVASR